MSAIAPPILFLLFISFLGGRAQQITLGSSLSPTTPPTSWPSPSGLFKFGFYRQDTGFAIAIWLVGNESDTVVWTANRDDGLLSSNAKLQLTKDGSLLVQTEQGKEMPIADTTEASSASMLDSGNFVLYSKNSSVIWQSFDRPTDTILGGQRLSSEQQLISGSSRTNHSSGRFCLRMQGDGNLVLYPVNTLITPRDAYWASNTYGRPVTYFYLNDTGNLAFGNSSGVNYMYRGVSSAKINAIYRATLESDGIFRLYAHYEGVSSLEWEALDNTCKVKGFCGFNSYCTFNDDKPYCLCLPGFNYTDQNDMTLGCRRNFSESQCRGGKENAVLYYISEMESISWNDINLPLLSKRMPKEECSLSCLEDCNCAAASYKDGTCFMYELPLKYIIRDTSSTMMAFIKVGNKSLNHSNDTYGPEPSPILTTSISITSNKAIVKIVCLTLGFSLFLCSSIAVSIHLIYKIQVLKYKRLLDIGELGLTEEVTLRTFSYNELSRATNHFKEELGKGSFGAVYKGTLYRGRRVIAVKRLEKLVEEGEREFQAEMQAIGRTHHRNLVRLLGYCSEGSKRLLVYEYMSNGSLAKLLFGATRRLYWDERVRIALDIARGILYLHEECEAPIIHCDIKPENILMDEFWTAKISDFGLAKLLMPDQTRTFTGVRGTRGYLAPEWQKNTPISVKADVYSYGIVLLEILCCRKNLDVNVSEPEQILLASWVYKCFVAGELHKLVLGEDADKNVLENMVKVALWCIQDEPVLRPTMKSVIFMMEGITEVSIPPSPTDISLWALTTFPAS
ncbi:hypothetical protein L6164_002132 [Bauhinia variegata]|uniref:Uncharacterized protein n=1 Tax=Bauhinia variegata TaxID=167791 RepID=A0ACB9PZC8_BAUVA|nr:hypothetical protein L6164_002132 [Bauhinia variegata]